MWLLAALALGLGVFVLSRNDESRRVRARIDQLAFALEHAPNDDVHDRRARIERAFAEVLAEDVLVKIPDYPELARGRTPLVERAVADAAHERGVEVDVRHVEIALAKDEQSALARLDVELKKPGDELHTDLRSVTLGFDAAGGSWRVTSVEVGPRTHAEPEARP